MAWLPGPQDLSVPSQLPHHRQSGEKGSDGLIVDHDPMTVAQRTRDTVLYIQSEWSKSHAEPIDPSQLHLFLCDERSSDLTEEQKTFARPLRDEMRSVYGAVVYRLMLCEEMLRRNMVEDDNAYRRVFYPEEGNASWTTSRAG